MDIRDLKVRLNQNAESVAAYLVPDGRKQGREWKAATIHGGKGDSFGICIRGDHVGQWKQFNPAEGEQDGDLLDLWMAVKGLSLVEAIKDAKQFLGIRDEDQWQGRKREYQAPERPKGKVAQTAVMEYLTTERKLDKWVVEQYKVCERGRLMIFPYLRDSELVMWKQIGIDRDANGKKTGIAASKDTMPILFGWHVLDPNDRRVTIYEGEIDAMSGFQYGYPGLSVPFGAGGGSKLDWVENDYEHLARFEEIFICVDQDNAGRSMIPELVQRLGIERCRIVELPHKDMNECLMQGVPVDEINECFAKAKNLDPDELRPAESYREMVRNRIFNPSQEQIGLRLPWDEGSEIGIREDELSVWTGPSGTGKSLITNQVLLQAVKAGEMVCIASFEMKAAVTLERMTYQVAGMREMSPEYFEAVYDWIAAHVWILDKLGNFDPDRMIDAFKYARKKYGVKHFVVDSLMKCVEDEEDNMGIKRFINKLVDFKNDYHCHVHLIAHTRKGSSVMEKMDKWSVKGTTAITDLADNVFIIWRNKTKEKARDVGPIWGDDYQDLMHQPDAVLTCDKQRNGTGWEGDINLNYHWPSQQYISRDMVKPFQYIEFSAIEEESLL